MSLLEFGDVCEHRDWCLSLTLKQLVWLELLGGRRHIAWSGGSFPAGKQVCLEGSNCESSWEPFSTYKDWQPSVGLQQKEAVGEPYGQELRGGCERWAKGPPLPACTRQCSGPNEGGLTTEIWHLESCIWQMFYRPEDHRQVDRLFECPFQSYLPLHSLAPHPFLTAGLRGKVLHCIN